MNNQLEYTDKVLDSLFEKDNASKLATYIESGLDINIGDGRLIYMAVEHNCYNMVYYLIKNGINLHSEYAKWILTLLIKKENLDLVKEFVLHGALIDDDILLGIELEEKDGLSDETIEYIKTIYQIQKNYPSFKF